jgi:chemotaxis protein MotB
VDHNEGPPPEIVIIRRGGGNHDEGHHGGAWKIAYADFMTAMMALFLVMWLINSTDQKTLSQVSTYFNPIELTDRTTTERGVQDIKDGGTGKQAAKQPNKFEDLKLHADPKNQVAPDPMSDEGLFSDPYEILAKIAAKATKVSPPMNGAHKGNNAPAAGDEAFRDPFDPEFRFNSRVDDDKDGDIRPKFDPATEDGEGQQQYTQEGVAKPKASGNAASADAGAQQPGLAGAQTGKQAPGAEVAKVEMRNAVEDKVAAETKQIESEMRKIVAESGLAKIPEISVEKTAEGILISMTDQANFEMFAVSSAEPHPELVVLMEKLAKILADKPGSLVIRGHTDGRPFRSKTYDNWRLSTARAHIAYYMLARGGLDTARIERIEGYADRSLKIADDPNAAQNRRIEVLLRPEKT